MNTRGSGYESGYGMLSLWRGLKRKRNYVNQ